MQTAYQMVWMSAERTPDHLALIDDLSDRRLTYAELIGEIDIVAAGLFERGIRQGDRVATVLPSLFEHCLLLLALQRLCAVPALINFRLSASEIRNLISDGDINAAVIGIPHKKWGEAVTACIVGDDIPVEDLERLFQNSELAQFKRPRIYVFLEIIPRNATNKIIRRELKANVLRSRTKETNYKIV